MTDQTPGHDALFRGLAQQRDLLAEVDASALDRPTHCPGWTLHDLVDHVVHSPATFAAMVRGEEVDWSAATPRHQDWSGDFDRHVEELRAAWESHPDAQPGPDLQCGEVAVHTWDLATTLERPTGGLDAEVAERGLAFMSAALTDENRTPAFGPERPAPAGADAYQRVAAFAGRQV